LKTVGAFFATVGKFLKKGAKIPCEFARNSKEILENTRVLW
jgi:hypothetical protein